VNDGDKYDDENNDHFVSFRYHVSGSRGRWAFGLLHLVGSGHDVSRSQMPPLACSLALWLFFLFFLFLIVRDAFRLFRL